MKKSYEDFINEVATIVKLWVQCEKSYLSCDHSSKRYNKGFEYQCEYNFHTIPPNDLEKFGEDLFLFESYESGGVSGGSCWDDSDPQPYSTDYSFENESQLDILLNSQFPTISYLQYKQLLALEEIDYYDVNEYYGNYTTYCYKKISLRRLYDKLVEMGIYE